MGYRLVIRRRVVVNLVTGTAIAGVLLKRSGPLLVLADATVFPRDGVESKVDGEVVVERSQVEFVQAMPAGR